MKPHPQTTTHHCIFQATINHATVHIKFPCSYFLHWKTDNNSHHAEGRSRPTALNSRIVFEETLTLEVEMQRGGSSGRWMRRETEMDLNLVSRSKSDCVKLVGRVGVDLAEVLNEGRFASIEGHKLSYCSVEAELVFSIEGLSKGQSP